MLQVHGPLLRVLCVYLACGHEQIHGGTGKSICLSHLTNDERKCMSFSTSAGIEREHSKTAARRLDMGKDVVEAPLASATLARR